MAHNGQHDPRKRSARPKLGPIARAPESSEVVESVLAGIPSTAFLVTASHDGRRSGALVSWVQRCSMEPPLVCLALRKGQPIEPLIRDSRAFALCQLAPDDLLLRRLFAESLGYGDDPFLSLPVRCTATGSPAPLRALAYVDCELTRHFDIESEYEIYVGLIREAAHLARGVTRDRNEDDASSRASRTG